MDEPVTIPTLAEVEAAHIRSTYALLNGKMSKIARALGIDRRTAYRKAALLGLKQPMPSEVDQLRRRVAELEAQQTK